MHNINVNDANLSIDDRAAFVITTVYNHYVGYSSKLEHSNSMLYIYNCSPIIKL